MINLIKTVSEMSIEHGIESKIILGFFVCLGCFIVVGALKAGFSK